MVLVGYLIALATLLVLGKRSLRRGRHHPRALELVEGQEPEGRIPVSGSSIIESTQVIRRTEAGSTITEFRLRPEWRGCVTPLTTVNNIDEALVRTVDELGTFLTLYDEYLDGKIDYHELHQRTGLKKGSWK